MTRGGVGFCSQQEMVARWWIISACTSLPCSIKAAGAAHFCPVCKCNILHSNPCYHVNAINIAGLVLVQISLASFLAALPPQC